MPRVEVSPHEKTEGVYWVSQLGEKGKLATLNLAPGTSVYGETSYKLKSNEYRVWDPYRSKLAAALMKGLASMRIKAGSKVLYLGAASGTTVSHVSDIVGKKGQVYCVEFAQRSFRDLVNNVCRERSNTTPVFEDARFPVKYRNIVPEVEVVYSDIAQPDQARILADNLDMFLRESGEFLFCVKSRSVDVTRNPGEVFEEEARVLEERGYKIIQSIRLDPFEMDHAMIIGSR